MPRYSAPMNTTTPSQAFREKVETFLRVSGMAPTTFGIKSCGDKHIVRKLRAGRTVTLITVDKITAYIDMYRSPLTGVRGNGRRNEPRASAA